MINNPINVTKLKNDIVTQVNAEIALKATETQAALIADNDVTQAQLNGMTTVNGTLDTNVTAINGNTDAQHVTTKSLVTSEADRVIASVPPPASVIKSLQRGYAAMNNGGLTSTTVTISAVNLAKTFLIFSNNSLSNVTYPTEYLIKGKLLNATTLEFKKGSGTGTVEIEWELIEYA